MAGKQGGEISFGTDSHELGGERGFWNFLGGHETVLTRIAGKVFFSIVTISACYFSEVFWESTTYQVLLPLVLLAVWFDWWILALFKSAEGNAPSKEKNSSQK